MLGALLGFGLLELKVLAAACRAGRIARRAFGQIEKRLWRSFWAWRAFFIFYSGFFSDFAEFFSGRSIRRFWQGKSALTEAMRSVLNSFARQRREACSIEALAKFKITGAWQGALDLGGEI